VFAFGHFLLDLSDGLGYEAIWGDLPLLISIRNGRVLEEWSGLKRSSAIKPPNMSRPSQQKYLEKRAAGRRERWVKEKTYRTRFPLINLRIQAEMHMLCGQPGINMAQLYGLRMDQWVYKPSTNGYELRTYKHRRWGGVVFEIYSDYRSLFERYLKWRASIFPNDPDGLLFPLLGKGGVPISRRADTVPQFSTLIKACARAGVKYVAPAKLRNTNVNWLLRKTQDPELTAEEKQHSKKTLLREYEKPSLQRAMVQTQIFWGKYDPVLCAVAPGMCSGNLPQIRKDAPPAATSPDCNTPAGCLFCVHHRDIDSFDHVWSLVSYRFLKLFELSAIAEHDAIAREHLLNPAQITIDRIGDKLNLIKESSNTRAAWVEEAMLRIEEQNYHPAWRGHIEAL